MASTGRAAQHHELPGRQLKFIIPKPEIFPAMTRSAMSDGIDPRN